MFLRFKTSFFYLLIPVEKRGKKSQKEERTLRPRLHPGSVGEGGAPGPPETSLYQKFQKLFNTNPKFPCGL